MRSGAVGTMVGWGLGWEFFGVGEMGGNGELGGWQRISTMAFRKVSTDNIKAKF